MSEWKTYKLNEVLEIKYGKDHKHLPDGDIPVYGSGGIMRYVEKHLYDKESILIPRKGTLSNIFYLNKPFWSVDTMFYTKIKDGVQGKYLYYLLKSMDLASMNIGSAVPSLTTEVLNKVEITIPDLATQRQIAQILSSLDDKIELNLQMNQTLEAMAQAIFKEWFVNFNFPGFDGVFENGLPKGWRMGKLGEVVSFIKGVSYRSSELVPSNFALVTLKSFNRFGGFNYRGFKEFFGKYNENQVLDEGDVIIAQTDITQAAEVIGCPAIVENPFEYEKLIASIDVVKCVPINIHFSKAVLFYFLNDKRFKDFCLSHSNGSTVLHLRSSELQNFEFPIPDNELLKQFTGIINPIREKIISNNKQIQTLTQIRDTLLPKLMSGKIRLNQDFKN